MGATLCVMLFCYLLSFNAYSQDQSNSIVHYDDGSVFIGKIVSKNDVGLVLYGSTMDTLNLIWDNIKRLHDGNDIILYNKGKFHKKSGFFGTLDFSFAPSTIITEGALIVGNRITPRYAVGAGAALSTTEVTIAGEWLWHDFHTYFGYGRYYLNQKKRRIFADARVGYGFPRNGGWNNEHNGGFHFQPGITMMFSSRTDYRFFISLSQYFQYTSGEFNGTDGFISDYFARYDLFYNRTMIKFGFQFK